jgi:hypothetical protein
VPARQRLGWREGERPGLQGSQRSQRCRRCAPCRRVEVDEGEKVISALRAYSDVDDASAVEGDLVRTG